MSQLGQSASELIRWDWVWRNLDDIGAATLEHLVLTGTAVGIGLAVSLALALWSVPSPRRYDVVSGVAGVLYSLPSLSAFALLVPFFGLTRTTALIPLVSYTLLILVRNIVTGIRGIDPAVREAALGMGHTPRSLRWQVELPLALPVILAGVRIATVTVVGLVTVASLIGHGGLGGLILSGLRRSIIFPTEIVVGTVGAIGLAAALDGLLLLLGRALTPWRNAARGL